MVASGHYYTFTGTSGNSYVFSFCQGGGSQSNITVLSIQDNTGATLGPMASQNCLGVSELIWNCTSTATYRINVAGFFCAATYATTSTMAFLECSPPTNGATCGSPVAITSVPYVQTGLSTCGAGDDYSSSDSCGSAYMDGEDFVFSLTLSAQDAIDVNLTNTETAVGLFVLDGCPDASGTNCIHSVESPSANPSIDSLVLNAGTYFIVVSTNPSTRDWTTFDIEVRSDWEGTTCQHPHVLSSLPYVNTTMTTNGSGDDYDNADTCKSSFLNGDDYVFEYTAPSTECLDIYVSSPSNKVSLFVYDGCPDATGTQCVATDAVIKTTPSLTGLSLNAGTYYFVVSSEPTPQWVNFTMNVDSCQPVTPCGTNPPAGDTCLVATDISGYSSFCGSTDTTLYKVDLPGNLNSVFCGVVDNNSWWKFTADSTTAIVNFNITSCDFGNGIQAQIFDTDCNTFTSVSNCFNPGTQQNGTLTATGLTIGNDYYIMVDGQAKDICEYDATLSMGQALPVAFGDIFATDDDILKLVWETKSESWSEGFFIDCGVKAGLEQGGIEWKEVGFIPSNGFSSETKRYEFAVPRDVSSESTIYRIRHKDLNGYNFHSDAIEVDSRFSVGDQVIGLYPNPTSGKLNVDFSATSRKEVRFEIYSFDGKILRDISAGSYDKGFHTADLNLSDLKPGIYVFRALIGGEISTTRLVVE